MEKISFSISVIMPAYNEEACIEEAVEQNIRTFSSLIPDFEILVVNDKSTDRSGEIAEAIAKRYENVFCYHHDANQGVGGSFQTGISHATKEYVIFVPFDNPLLPEDLEAYLPLMGVCDIVVGFRAERVGYSSLARFASFVYNRILTPLIFNIGIADVNWIQAYRRNLFTDQIISFHNSRIFFLVEILVQARRSNLIIAEVPAKMAKRYHGLPTNSRFSTMWNTFWDMILFFRKIRKADKKKVLR